MHLDAVKHLRNNLPSALTNVLHCSDYNKIFGGKNLSDIILLTDRKCSCCRICIYQPPDSQTARPIGPETDSHYRQIQGINLNNFQYFPCLLAILMYCYTH